MFIVLQALTMVCFAFTSSNLGTLAMEHMAPIAGTASSVQGVIGTIGGGDRSALPSARRSTAPHCRSCRDCGLCGAVGLLLIVSDRAEAAVRRPIGAERCRPEPDPDAPLREDLG